MTIADLLAFGNALNNREVRAAAGFFTEDGCYLASSGPDIDGRRFEGRAEVAAGLERFLAEYPDGRYEDVTFVVAGDRGFGEWTFVGTSLGGTAVRIRGCDLYEFEGRRIKCKNAFRKQLVQSSA